MEGETNGRLRLMTALYIERAASDTHGEQILLLYRVGSRVVPPSWCGVGGHFEKDEISDAQACVLRELEEETQIRREMLVNLRFKYVTLRRKNGEIRQNFYFFAALRDDMAIELTCNEGCLAWVDKTQALGLDMPHTAKAVLAHYFAGGQNDDCVYGGMAAKSGVHFTPLEEF